MSRSASNWLFISAMVIAGIFLAHPSALMSKPLIDNTVDIIGLLVSLSGLALRVVSRHWKIEHGDGKLVTSGPYGVVRHPLYLGSFLAGLGLCLIIGSAWFLVVFVVGYLLVHIRIAQGEERYLSGVWAEEYSEYMDSVPGWLPSPVRIIRIIKPCIGCLNKKAVLRERSAVCGILAGASLLEAWSDYAVKGWAQAQMEVIVCLSLTVLFAAVMICLRNAPKYGCKT